MCWQFIVPIVFLFADKGESIMKKTALILMLILCVLLSGCAPQPEPVDAGSSLLVGFSQLGSESNWRIGNTESVIQAAKDAGFQLMYENAEQKQEKQIDALRSFIAYQVDVIILAPIVEEGWTNVLTEAKAAGIPVIVCDRMVDIDDESLYASFVGADFFQEGHRAAEYLLKKAEGMDQINIVEISGTEDSTPTTERAEGFRSGIAGDDRFKIIASVCGEFLISRGKECMQQLLDTYDDIDVMFSHNDSMTLGAIEAIEEHGLVPGKDIIIITVDGEQKAIDFLKEGKINCVVECTPLIGDMVMDLVKRLAAGEEIERYTYPEETMFTEFDEDLDSIAERGY